MAKKILVVDDDPGNVLMLESFLKDRGYTVVIANDGEEAVHKAKAQMPDLILLDIMMPKMDGTEVAVVLKEDANTRHIPIFYLTAVITAEDRVERIGASNIIFPKPVNFNELLEHIKQRIG